MKVVKAAFCAVVCCLLQGCGITRMPPPDPANACTMEEVTCEVMLTQAQVASDFEAIPAHVALMLWKVDDQFVRLVITGGTVGFVVAGIGSGKVYPAPNNPTFSVRYVPPPPAMEPVLIPAGRHKLTFRLLGQFWERWQATKDAKAAGVFTAEHSCEVELTPLVDYLARTEMAGPDIYDGVYLVIEEAQTGTVIYDALFRIR